MHYILQDYITFDYILQKVIACRAECVQMNCDSSVYDALMSRY